MYCYKLFYAFFFVLLFYYFLTTIYYFHFLAYVYIKNIYFIPSFSLFFNSVCTSSLSVTAAWTLTTPKYLQKRGNGKTPIFPYVSLKILLPFLTRSSLICDTSYCLLTYSSMLPLHATRHRSHA